MAKGFAPAPESPQRQTQPTERKLAVDAEQVQEQWLSHFQTLADPRGKQGQEYGFLSIVVIAILAVVGGATGWEDIELYAESHQEWLVSLFGLGQRGAPCRYLQAGVWALSLLNQETSTKRSLRQKAKRASMNSDYMLKVLSAALPQ